MILCLLLLPLFGGWGVMFFFFCYAALSLFWFSNHLGEEERELGALLILSGCYCSLNIPHGAMDWFAVVTVPFPGHTHLLLVLNIYIKQEDY